MTHQTITCRIQNHRVEITYDQQSERVTYFVYGVGMVCKQVVDFWSFTLLDAIDGLIFAYDQDGDYDTTETCSRCGFTFVTGYLPCMC